MIVTMAMLSVVVLGVSLEVFSVSGKYFFQKYILLIFLFIKLKESKTNLEMSKNDTSGTNKYRKKV